MAPLEPQPRYLVRRPAALRGWAVLDTQQGGYIVGNYTEAEAWRLADALNAAPEHDRAELIRQAWHRRPRRRAQQLEEVTPPADT